MHNSLVSQRLPTPNLSVDVSHYDNKIVFMSYPGRCPTFAQITTIVQTRLRVILTPTHRYHYCVGRIFSYANSPIWIAVIKYTITKNRK